MAFDVRLAGLEQETFLGLAADLVTNEGRRDPCERPRGRRRPREFGAGI